MYTKYSLLPTFEQSTTFVHHTVPVHIARIVILFWLGVRTLNAIVTLSTHRVCCKCSISLDTQPLTVEPGLIIIQVSCAAGLVSELLLKYYPLRLAPKTIAQLVSSNQPNWLLITEYTLVALDITINTPDKHT